MLGKHINPENFTSNTHIVSSHVLAFIRQKFWIVQDLSTVRRVLANYMICRKQNARPGHLNRLWPHSRQNESLLQIFHLLGGWGENTSVPSSLNKDTVRWNVMDVCSYACVAYQRFASSRGKPKEIVLLIDFWSYKLPYWHMSDNRRHNRFSKLLEINNTFFNRKRESTVSAT